jgi:ADP-heptose:LPS heptosyltransferase
MKDYTIQIVKLIIHLLTTIPLLNKKGKIIPKTIILIRLDAIGDYILFRNFIKILKNSEKYKNYKIILIGNIIWKDITETFDKEFINEFIWINVKKFTINPIYRYAILKKIIKKGCEIVINPTYSRVFYTDDNIVKLINAKEKIGSMGDLSNIKKWQRIISNKYYTKLLPTKNDIIFEFYRNKEFFDNLLNKNIRIIKPSLHLKEEQITLNLPKKFSILFIGASSKFKKWEIRKFVAIGKFLKETFGYDIVLCGGPTDLKDAKQFGNFADYEYLDLVSQTTLIEFINVIYKGSLMISNDTSAPHLAVSLNKTNIFVLYNGNHFGRFVPYPKEICQGYHPIYHPYIKENINDYKKISNRYTYKSELDINDISVEIVKKEINKVLKNIK